LLTGARVFLSVFGRWQQLTPRGAPRASLTEAGPGVTFSASGGGPTLVDMKVRAAHRSNPRPPPAHLALSHLLTVTALALSTAGAAADADANADAAAAAADVAAAAARYAGVR
jgi:hypothetical protein